MLNRMYILMITLLLCLVVVGCTKTGNHAAQTPNSAPNPETTEKTPTMNPASTPEGVPEKSSLPSPVESPSPTPFDPIEEQIQWMTLDQKIGQMVLLGVEGLSVNSHTRALIEQYHVGGFILYKENIENTNQALSYLNELKALNKGQIPLFLSVDQEGGKVSRMPGEYTKIPTNRVIGMMNKTDFSYQIGVVLAGQIKSVGFNMNYAPVLDINSNPKNPVIGDRSFGSSVEVVSKLGVQTMLGIQSQNIIPVVKHFPGHGDTSVDSHLELPVVDKSLSELRKFELIPFAEAIKNNADVVMIAHILLPQMETNNPASFSKTVITELLRKELQFNGVVITDDMTMGGIVEHYDMKQAAVNSVLAGSDIIMVAHGFDQEVEVIAYLKKSVEDGTISEDLIDNSVYRILKLKMKYHLSDQKVISVDVATINEEARSLLGKYIK